MIASIAAPAVIVFQTYALEPIGNIPSAEAEARYHALSRDPSIAAGLTQIRLRQTRHGSPSIGLREMTGGDLILSLRG